MKGKQNIFEHLCNQKKITETFHLQQTVQTLSNTAGSHNLYCWSY